MRHFAWGAIAAALVTSLSVQAIADENACLEGDVAMGPNCVHTEARTMRDPISTVYRVQDREILTVWYGVGSVTKSTSEFIIVLEPVSDSAGRVRIAAVRHDWAGSEYER